MVTGLAIFRKHFLGYSDQFVLIGGTACDLLMSKAGFRFRTTKDFDIVLLIESLTPAFRQAFWEFIRSGGYLVKEREDGAKQHFRFTKPSNPDYPIMLELFSRGQDGLGVPEGTGVTLIPGSDGISGLSAILLDEAYYGFLKSGRKEVDGLPVIGLEHLLVMKAKAWLDLSARKRNGENVDSRDIQKHKRDIFRLLEAVDPGLRAEVPDGIANDIREFLDAMRSEGLDLQAIGVDSVLEEALEDFRRMFLKDQGQANFP